MKFIVFISILFIGSIQSMTNFGNYNPIHRKWMMIEYGKYKKEELIARNAFMDLSQIDNENCNMGCNTIHIAYKLMPKSKFEIKNLTATEKACDKSNLEVNFIKDIRKINQYKIEGHKLILTGKDKLKMVFIAQDWD